MELISNYMNNDTYRHMLNELTRKTFGFDFESWVAQGYFEGDYIPYSFMSEGRIISNVSVNRMKFMQNGAMKPDYSKSHNENKWCILHHPKGCGSNFYRRGTETNS